MLIKPLPMLLQVFSLPLKNPVLIFSLTTVYYSTDACSITAFKDS